MPLLPFRLITLALLVLATIAPYARADLGVMVADPTHTGSSRYTDAGHSLIFLSGVCPATPVRARHCNPGEQGSILTMYPNFREAQPYSWNLVPASLYLQGSQAPGNRLLYGSRYVKQALELYARENLLRPVCQQNGDTGCPEIPHSYWRDLVAATIDRDIFLYAVHTTPAEDQHAIDWLNRAPNINRFNPVTNNCADFAASFIDSIFPHSVHRDLLNDVGMMTPKAVARSFTLWSLKNPELGFYSLHFAQQPGDLPRSGLARSGTETVIHTKKYVIPAIVLGDWELPTSIFASYIFTGRFSLYNEYARHPADNGSPPGPPITGQTQLTGTPQEWASYRERFAAIQDSPKARALAPVRGRFFPHAYASATASVDARNLPWLTPDPSEPNRRVGLSSENLLAPNSDPQFAFQLILGRVAYALASKNRMRESMPEFRQDWALLEQAQSRLPMLASGPAGTAFPREKPPTQIAVK